MINLIIGWRRSAIIGAACAAAGFAGGWKARDVLADAAEGRRATAAASGAVRAVTAELQRSATAARVSDAVGRRSAERQTAIRTNTIEILREVPVYVTAQANAGCVVPHGFVRLHDAAATGADPGAVSDPAAPPHDAPSGTSLTEVSGRVIENYGVCRAEAERLKSLQDWLRAQSETWNNDHLR